MWQEITISILAFLSVISFAVFNGLFILWDRATGEERKALSKQWHGVGLILKTMIGITMLVALFPNWILMASTGLIYLLLAWSIYNGVINKYLGQSFWYIGNTAWFDKWGRKHPILFWGLQLVILLLAIGMSKIGRAHV